jgi:hypothetical protein
MRNSSLIRPFLFVFQTDFDRMQFWNTMVGLLVVLQVASLVGNTAANIFGKFSSNG